MSSSNRRGRGGGSGGSGGHGRGGGKHHRQPQSREVTVSKALSFLLRHGARDEGVQLDEGGWANVRNVVSWFLVFGFLCVIVLDGRVGEYFGSFLLLGRFVGACGCGFGLGSCDMGCFAVRFCPSQWVGGKACNILIRLFVAWFDFLSECCSFLKEKKSNLLKPSVKTSLRLPSKPLTPPPQLLWRRLASMHVTFPELQSLVATNEKQRFSLEPLSPEETLSPQATQANTTTTTDDPSHYRIRASQGHTLTTISPSLIYTPLDPSLPTCPNLVVHGTDEKSWLKIHSSGGLKPMARTHIHFATALPKRLPPLDKTFQSKSKPPKEEGGEENVISGVRNSSTIFVWVDVKRSAREGGVQWWVSRNGVVLTEGVEGVLGLEWVRWVERRGGEVLFGVKDGVAEEEFLRRAEEAKTQKGKGPVAGMDEPVEGGVEGGKVVEDDDGGQRVEKGNWDD